MARPVPFVLERGGPPSRGLPEPPATPPREALPLSTRPAHFLPPMRTLPRLVGPVLLLGALAAGALAQIKKFTLEEMVQTADAAVQGQIIASRVFRVDSPRDGADLFYTTITIQGRTLRDAQPITIDVTFRGGFA